MILYTYSFSVSHSAHFSSPERSSKMDFHLCSLSLISLFLFSFFLFLHHSHILIVVFVAHSDFMPVGIILIATSLCFERQVCGIWRP